MTRTQYTDATVEGLAHLRAYAAKYPMMKISEAINALDNAGVFSDLDQQTDYASAEEILQDTYRRGLEAQHPNTADPAEWGDTTTADMAEHQTGRHRRVPVDEPLVGAEADRMRERVRALGPLERVPGTDVLRPRRSHGSLASDND